jgi:hypothetical protein
MSLRFICLLLAAVLLSSCHNDAMQKITCEFQPAYKPAKQVTTKIYSASQGFCGQTIYINSDSTFTWDHTCEGRSASSVGKWRIIGDSILLNPAPKANSIAYHVSFSRSGKDTRVVIIVKDKTNSPIEDFVILPFNDKPPFTFTDDGVLMGNKGYNLSYFQDNLSTDINGAIKFQKSEKDSLDFSKLYALTGKTFRISTGNLPDTIYLMVSINAAAFSQYQVRYINDKPTKFKYTNGQLVLTKQ